jgi:hypothetical protein
MASYEAVAPVQGGQEGRRPFSKALACFTAVAMFGERLSILVISTSTPRKLTPLSHRVLPPPGCCSLITPQLCSTPAPARTPPPPSPTYHPLPIPPSFLTSPPVPVGQSSCLALASHPRFPSQSPPLSSFFQRFSLAMARQQAVEIQSLQANATDAPGEPRPPPHHHHVVMMASSRVFFCWDRRGRRIKTGEEVEGLGVGWVRG